MESDVENFPETDIQVVLRGDVDAISFEVPRLDASTAASILCTLFRSTGARFMRIGKYGISTKILSLAFSSLVFHLRDLKSILSIE